MDFDRLFGSVDLNDADDAPVFGQIDTVQNVIDLKVARVEFLLRRFRLIAQVLLRADHVGVQLSVQLGEARTGRLVVRHDAQLHDRRR
jgi:hypothetical protein